jgi:NADP-dependent 3-hydroxy acid dehydrogenase YdfG
MPPVRLEETRIMIEALRGRTAVVTGAGRGLGAALAIVLADAGATPVLCGRSRDALDGVAAAIAARTGRRPGTIPLDLADPAGAERAAQEVLQRHPAVDLLVNNGAAWLAQRDTPFSAAEVAGVIGSAITGTFLVTQALLPALTGSGRGDVVTIGSISGQLNAPIQTTAVPFYAAKHGQAGLADGLRQMLAGTPVRSICIHPPILEDISPLDPAWDDVPNRPKGAWLTNRDIVEAVIFAVTRPRHVTIASLLLDSDGGGLF